VESLYKMVTTSRANDRHHALEAAAASVIRKEGTGSDPLQREALVNRRLLMTHQFGFEVFVSRGIRHRAGCSLPGDQTRPCGKPRLGPSSRWEEGHARHGPDPL